MSVNMKDRDRMEWMETFCNTVLAALEEHEQEMGPRFSGEEWHQPHGLAAATLIQVTLEQPAKYLMFAMQLGPELFHLVEEMVVDATMAGYGLALADQKEFTQGLIFERDKLQARAKQLETYLETEKLTTRNYQAELARVTDEDRQPSKVIRRLQQDNALLAGDRDALREKLKNLDAAFGVTLNECAKKDGEIERLQLQIDRADQVIEHKNDSIRSLYTELEKLTGEHHRLIQRYEDCSGEDYESDVEYPEEG